MYALRQKKKKTRESGLELEFLKTYMNKFWQCSLGSITALQPINNAYYSPFLVGYFIWHSIKKVISLLFFWPHVKQPILFKPLFCLLFPLLLQQLAGSSGRLSFSCNSEKLLHIALFAELWISLCKYGDLEQPDSSAH